MNHPNLRRRAALLAGAVLITTALVAPPGSAQPPTGPTATSLGLPTFAPGRYVVTLADKPVATYQGGVSGLKATKPTAGRKVEVNSADAKRYRTFLSGKHAEVAARVGAKVTHDYSTALNAFAASLTSKQVNELSKTAGVVSVVPDQMRVALDDRKSTDFLKLSGNSGVWKALGGTASAGKGVVVGVVDTGIWPESASFAGPALGTSPPTAADPYRPYRSGSETVMQKADGDTFTGSCEAGEQFTADLCNTKLISAKYFGDGWLSFVPPEARADYVSPRDGEGHGSHTASTAAGNPGVDVAVDGVDFGTVSGFHRRPRSPSTRPSGKARTARTPAASPPTSWPRSTRPWRTASTSSTTR